MPYKAVAKPDSISGGGGARSEQHYSLKNNEQQRLPGIFTL